MGGAGGGGGAARAVHPSPTRTHPHGRTHHPHTHAPRHRLLVFRDQGVVSGERHVEISQLFGELESTFYKHPASPHPDVFRVSNDPAQGCTGGFACGWGGGGGVRGGCTRRLGLPPPQPACHPPTPPIRLAPQAWGAPAGTWMAPSSPPPLPTRCITRWWCRARGTRVGGCWVGGCWGVGEGGA